MQAGSCYRVFFLVICIHIFSGRWESAPALWLGNREWAANITDIACEAL